MSKNTSNLESATVEGFGLEWSAYDQSGVTETELNQVFRTYFKIFPWHLLDPSKSVGADFGCGSGRWSKFLSPYVRHLHLIDASEAALKTAKQRLHSCKNLSFHHCSIEDFRVNGDGIADPEKLDFAISLGVLHHLPDVPRALKDIFVNLRPGAPLLLYLYYALDGRSKFYRMTWFASDQFRKLISLLPFKVRISITQILAALIYWPLARTALALDHFNILPLNFPLAFYRRSSFYVMKNDSLDRFGTRLEKRFSRQEIENMLTEAGFENIRFSDEAPFWCSIAYKKGSHGTNL